MGSNRSLPIAWYGRVLVVIGFAVTVGTGAGLFLAPRSLGENFAWTIKVPLTAAFIGAGYLAGAALGLALVLRDGLWPRSRIVLATAFVLLVTNLIATLRFVNDFHLASGSGLQQVVAWVWLVVYVTLPPAVLAVLIAHERRAGRATWRVEEPLTPVTRALFAATAAGLTVVGLWLFFDPDGALATRWPWHLTPVSAAIVGTWPLTFAATFGWALVERDWRRVRIAVAPGAAVTLSHLFSAARLSETFTGGNPAAIVYVASVASIPAVLGAAWFSQRARRDLSN
ncbi:MAG: hypothetical protein ABR583_08140 [Gaiellaceae bacterium]